MNEQTFQTMALGAAAQTQLDRWAYTPYQEPYTPPGVPQNCGVMVDVRRIAPEIRRMNDVIHGIALGNGISADEVDEDSIAVLLQEAINHYLSYALTNSTAKNIGFDYYLDEYFARFAPYVRAQEGAMAFLTNQFVMCVGVLAEQLYPAVDKLELVGQEVSELQAVTIKPGRLQLYIVEGTGFDNGEDGG